MSLLVLSAADVRQVVSSFSPTFLQDLMGHIFLAISHLGGVTTSDDNSDIQTPHRTTIDMMSHTTLFMPARISSSQLSLEGTSIKVVSVPRKQDDIRGLPATTLVLNEDTGAVEAVVNSRELTALRNAAGPFFDIHSNVLDAQVFAQGHCFRQPWLKSKSPSILSCSELGNRLKAISISSLDIILESESALSSTAL